MQFYYFSSERSVWLDAVSGIYIIGVILGWFSVMIVQLGFWNQTEIVLFERGIILTILAGKNTNKV